jgi:argininosuccinate synthase
MSRRLDGGSRRATATALPAPKAGYGSTAVLAYSGGLDTSCAIAWLKEDYGFDTVVAVLVDVGQEADFGPAIERGRLAGADEVLLLDRKTEFAGDQVAKALLANALYEGRYPLVSSLSRPVIAGAVAEVALDLRAEAVVHGCTGKGNDQLRFELAFKARYPDVTVIAPLRDRVWTRDEEIAYAEARGIPVEAKAERPYSIDDNLLGRAIEAGVLEDPWTAPPEDAFALTGSPAAAPAPRDVVVGFERGLPLSLDGEELDLPELVAALNELAGPYGIGRIDMIENRAVGIKSRELYEAPGAMTLIEAHRALEELVLTKAELHAKRELEPRWATLVYEGLWFHPLRSAYDAFFAATQEPVTGEVRVVLQAGTAVVSGRRSPHALYAETLASYGSGETFPHEAAEGFIRIAALETELLARRALSDALVG